MNEHWQPLYPASMSYIDPELKKLADSCSLEIDTDLWMNHLYTVSRRVFPGKDGSPGMAHLSIKRNDRGVTRDWRHLQYIKNQLLGPECEAMELFPAESRLVDTANQYHLWGSIDPDFRFPLGFNVRAVMEEMSHNTVQRPFEPGMKPKDLLTYEQFRNKVSNEAPAPATDEGDVQNVPVEG